MSYNHKLFRQTRSLGTAWGNLKLVAQNANIYVQFLILGFSSVGAYVGISAWLLARGIQFPFWLFTLVVFCPVATLCFFVWRLDIPSTFLSWNLQWWEHGNPLRAELEAMREREAKRDELIAYLVERERERERREKGASVS